MLVAAGISVWLLNWFYRLGVRGDRERDREDRARAYFDAHGRWPDEDEPLPARSEATPRRRRGRPTRPAPAHRTAPPGPRARLGRLPSDAAARRADRHRRRVGSAAVLADPATVPDLAAARAGEPGGWASTRSSWARAATARCSASSRSPSRSEPGGEVRVAVLDPLDRALDPAPLAGRARRPRDRGRAARRAPGRRAAAPRLADRGAQRLRHAGRRRLRRAARPAGLRGAAAPGASACACARARASRAGTRARSAPSRWSTPARTCCTSSSSADALQEQLAGRGRLEWAREECRALEEASDERDPDVALRPPAARQLARPRPARGRARARRVARAHGRRGRPAGHRHPARRPARGDRQAPAPQRRSPGPDPRAARGHPAPPRDGDPGRGRARPRAPADPGGGRAPAAAGRGRRAAHRARRGARARARRGGRAGLRAHRRPRRPAARGERRCAPTRPRRTCARCAAGGGRWSAPSCSSCCRAAGRCGWATAGVSRCPSRQPETSAAGLTARDRLPRETAGRRVRRNAVRGPQLVTQHLQRLAAQNTWRSQIWPPGQ